MLTSAPYSTKILIISSHLQLIAMVREHSLITNEFDKTKIDIK